MILRLGEDIPSYPHFSQWLEHSLDLMQWFYLGPVASRPTRREGLFFPSFTLELPFPKHRPNLFFPTP